MSERQPSKKKKSKKGSKSNGATSSGGGGEMVPYEDPESASNGRPQRSEQRRSNGQQPSQRRSNRNQYPTDDDMSDVSDAEYTTNNQEEPQFKYSTADLQENSWRNGTCCIILVCIICIVVAIVLSVVMVKIQDDKAEEPTSAPTSEGTLPSPPAPPGANEFQRSQASVNNRCSEENFNIDKDTCLETCSGFDCCDPALPESQSCLLNNREGCLNYARCHVTNNQIEPAPVNLHDICSPERLAQDSSECELECQQLECCWSDDISCISENFYACLDYAPCQNMRSDANVVTAPTTLIDLCSDSAGSVTQSGVCDDACAAADCCWSESSSDNCLQSDFFACLTYEPCKQLELPPAGFNVTAPTANVANSCTATVTETAQGKAVCQDACKNGNCCVEGASDYCFLEDPLGCLPYDSCKNAS